MIVVDASVAAKWYLPEVGSDAALGLLAGPHLLYAPELVRIEVLAALARRVRTGEAKTEETRRRCSIWRRHLDAGAISLVSDREIIEEALGLSLGIPHNLQDCLYLALAKRLDASLVTADRVFHERAMPHFSRMTLLPGCEAN
ncbi:type II toxin-antitoxin system VapC family toxin [Singulisphaera sp. PoT]|uniref:type II toxin-antitoxin system VapC family toxin n=1 Tax=Singulisphaera sp. PoT TaxID=3411797 RepID=UPI003BF4A469